MSTSWCQRWSGYWTGTKSGTEGSTLVVASKGKSGTKDTEKSLVACQVLGAKWVIVNASTKVNIISGVGTGSHDLMGIGTRAIDIMDDGTIVIGMGIVGTKVFATMVICTGLISTVVFRITEAVPKDLRDNSVSATEAVSSSQSGWASRELELPFRISHFRWLMGFRWWARKRRFVSLFSVHFKILSSSVIRWFSHSRLSVFNIHNSLWKRSRNTFWYDEIWYFPPKLNSTSEAR